MAAHPENERWISSPQNERVKALVALRRDGAARRAEDAFFLEGRRAVQAALELAPDRLRELIYCEPLWQDAPLLAARARELGVPVTRVSKDVFKKIADVPAPQGVAAVLRRSSARLEELLDRPRALVVVACGIQDPGNLGTLIRSCEAAGAAGLVALEETADFYNSKVVRSTAAALLSLPLTRLSATEFLRLARLRGLRLVSSSAKTGMPYRQFDWRARPLALCIGSEGAGVPPELEAACQERVTIPMLGRAESLNAAVAASLLLFESAQAAAAE